jgi:hypothetical protein
MAKKCNRRHVLDGAHSAFSSVQLLAVIVN